MNEIIQLLHKLFKKLEHKKIKNNQIQNIITEATRIPPEKNVRKAKKSKCWWWNRSEENSIGFCPGIWVQILGLTPFLSINFQSAWTWTIWELSKTLPVYVFIQVIGDNKQNMADYCYTQLNIFKSLHFLNFHFPYGWGRTTVDDRVENGCDKQNKWTGALPHRPQCKGSSTS